MTRTSNRWKVIGKERVEATQNGADTAKNNPPANPANRRPQLSRKTAAGELFSTTQ
ncbi:MAG: hypothetical protein J6Y19_00480 [Kiritimatiellae bacterium]|nr:hypothetical protein [Kiritimatiellia bacterium]